MNNSNASSGEEKSKTKEESTTVLTLQTLLSNVGNLVRGELQVGACEYEQLEELNIRANEEFEKMIEFTSGLSTFVDELDQKNGKLVQCMQEIDSIDSQVTELEAIVSTLDSFSANLESKLKGMYLSQTP